MPTAKLAKFMSLDGCMKDMWLPTPLNRFYSFAIYPPPRYRWHAPETLIPSKSDITTRDYELYDEDTHTAIYKEVYHECGTEAAVKRALAEQKLEFEKKFNSFYYELFGPKSEPKVDHSHDKKTCMCQSCLWVRVTADNDNC